MLSDHSLRRIQSYWESHLGCGTGSLFSEPVRHVRHGGELVGYEGLFALFRGGKVVLSVPSQSDGKTGLPAGVKQAFQKWLWVQDFTPESLAQALRPLATRVIGPAFIGYAEAVSPPEPASHPVRALAAGDAQSVESLEAVCDPTEWEHGGSPIEQVCSGVFVGGELAALAGYEVWGGTIAHISIVTHPAHRGKRYGRNAVAHVARRALEAGLLPQYRTLQSNGASIRIAEPLGFEKYAVSVAARF